MFKCLAFIKLYKWLISVNLFVKKLLLNYSEVRPSEQIRREGDREGGWEGGIEGSEGGTEGGREGGRETYRHGVGEGWREIYRRQSDRRTYLQTDRQIETERGRGFLAFFLFQ